MLSRLLLIASVLLAACCVILVFKWWALLLAIPLFKRHYKRFTAFGTARWADESDLHPNANGLLIGRLAAKPRRSFFAIFNPRINSWDACKAFWGKQESRLVRIPAIHSAIFAPTGVGKGVSFVIPHGLTCKESTVFIDFKGEIARATAEARRKMGHRVVWLDPFRQVTDTPDTFNPLDFIIGGDSPLGIDDTGSLAESLVIRTGQEKEPHWGDAAEMFISGIASFVVQHAPPEDRSLQTVRGILADPEELEAAIQVMRQSPAWDGMLARMGGQLKHFRDKELSSSLTTTGRFLRFLDTLAIAESTKRSSFDPAELLTGKMSVYLILPPEHMRTQSPLLRLWIGSLLRAVVRGGLSKRQVHFVLDEAASLGHMDCLDDAVDKFRGYGVRLQFYYQSLGQLKKCFPEGQDQTLLANTTTAYFGVNDQQTAEYVSARLGEETIIVESGGTSTGRSRQTSDHASQGSSSYSYNANANWAQNARKLLKPEEITALDERIAITFTPGKPPIWTTLVRYYEKDFQTPGRLGRLWARVKMFALCLSLFVMSSIAVMALLGMNIHRR
jgi:type IV secretion system protein VirD4